MEPAAWAVFDGSDRMHVAKGYGEAESCAEDIGGEIVPLYRVPTLTDAEREAIRGAILELDGIMQEFIPTPVEMRLKRQAATLRGLLERTK